MVSKISALLNSKKDLECKVQDLESLVAKKEKILKKVSTKLERTQKSMKMLNLGTSKLDDILTLGKLQNDQRGLGFTGEASESKTVFVKDSFHVVDAATKVELQVAKTTVVATRRKTVT